MHTSMEPYEMHLQVLRELVDEVIKPSHLRSRGSPVKFPLTGKGGNITLIFRKGKKED